MARRIGGLVNIAVPGAGGFSLRFTRRRGGRSEVYLDERLKRVEGRRRRWYLAS